MKLRNSRAHRRSHSTAVSVGKKRRGRRASAVGRGDKLVLRALRPLRSGRLVHISDWERMAQDAQYSARELARQCTVSLRHLQRHFHDGYGLKLRSWLNELRLWEALLMLNTERSVKEVALQLGFKQCSHFSREFKKYHGISPSAVETLRVWRPPAGAKPLGNDKADPAQLTLL